MSIKQKFAIYFSLLFSILLSIVLVVVFTLYANFREEEFRDRLEEKAATTLKLLLDVEEVDYNLLKVIDKNTVTRLYKEKVMVFNDSLKLIYSSVDNTTISWTNEELLEIKKQTNVYKKINELDVYGFFYDSNNKDYYILVSAEDKYGNRKLAFLKSLLIISFVAGCIISFIASFLLSKKVFKPLDYFTKQILQINPKKLHQRIELHKQKDEIQQLGIAFNDLLSRIETAYEQQKNFTANASHEIRTPLARLVTQLENLKQNVTDTTTLQVLHSLSEEAYMLSDIVSSLLILSKVNEQEIEKAFKIIRIDEVIFKSISWLQQQHTDLKFNFEIQSQLNDTPLLEIKGDEMLLTIAFNNLFKNAYHYSNNKIVSCTILSNHNKLSVSIINHGPTITKEEVNNIFLPFKRGVNTTNKTGSGLGLSIVKRITDYHKATITYTSTEKSENKFTITFHLQN
jgi:signal transduction histidine kinase